MKIDEATGYRLSLHKTPEGIASSLHFSRRFEYPWAILTATPFTDLDMLDIGGGRGPLQFYLSRFGKVTNLDINAEDVAWVNTEASHLGCDKTLSALEGNATEINFPDCTFDRIFCISVFEHMGINNILKAINEIFRVLKYGGLAILTWDCSLAGVKAMRHLNWMEHTQLIRQLKISETKKGWNNKLISTHTSEGMIMSKEPLSVFCTTLQKVVD